VHSCVERYLLSCRRWQTYLTKSALWHARFLGWPTVRYYIPFRYHQTIFHAHWAATTWFTTLMTKKRMMRRSIWIESTAQWKLKWEIKWTLIWNIHNKSNWNLFLYRQVSEEQNDQGNNLIVERKEIWRQRC